ncbi:MAG: ABC transporter substrate-binding protein [Propionibacteriaceae bacterium]|nr:ABC transporter substrate-binding protein [Propionibacteriaceae bacterium]
MARRTLIILTTLALCVLAGCAQPMPEDEPTPTGLQTDQITIDMVIQHFTFDPAAVEHWADRMVAKATYDTLVTFANDDTTTVVPSLASYTVNDNLTVYTFTLVGERLFSDGTVLTIDDVAYSLEKPLSNGVPREIEGATVKKVDDQTLTITLKNPWAGLPAVLASPTWGILNSTIVKAQSSENNDDRQAYLDENTAGSGPYILKTYDQDGAVLEKNPYYNGSQNPTYDTVVLRNVTAAQQRTNLVSGDTLMALDLDDEQIATLDASLEVFTAPYPNVVYMSMNQNAEVNQWTATPQCVKAIKAALDYDKIVELAGHGATQATGVIPQGFLGALPASQALIFDLDTASKDADACGLAGRTIAVRYDKPGEFDELFADLAPVITQQLATVGIVVEIKAHEGDAVLDVPSPITLTSWRPLYQDPVASLDFGPGQPQGLSVGWTSAMNKNLATTTTTLKAMSPTEDRGASFEDWGRAMNTDSPYLPLIQTGVTIAHHPSVTNVNFNPLWGINLAGLGAQ